jgi:hypothetical protein
MTAKQKATQDNQTTQKEPTTISRTPWTEREKNNKIPRNIQHNNSSPTHTTTKDTTQEKRNIAQHQHNTKKQQKNTTQDTKGNITHQSTTQDKTKQ